MSVVRQTLKSQSLFHRINRFLTTQIYSIEHKPSSAQYDELINTAGRQKDFTTVHRLLNKRMKDGFFNTSNTFNFISSDLSVLNDLLQTLTLLDEGFCRKNSYDSLIARLCKMKRSDEALRVVGQMIRLGHGANAVTFNPIIKTLMKTRKVDEVDNVINLMRENDIVPDMFAFNLILMSYCFAGDLGSAAGVLTKINEAGMEADSKTYDALVLGACKAGKVDGALRIMRRMVDMEMSMMYSTPAHVIGALCRLGYFAQAVEFVVAFGGRREGLDNENFTLLWNRLIKFNRIDEAEFVAKEMKKRGLHMGQIIKDFYELRCVVSD